MAGEPIGRVAALQRGVIWPHCCPAVTGIGCIPAEILVRMPPRTLKKRIHADRWPRSRRSLRSGEPYSIVSRSELYGLMQIIVRDNNVDQALRALKKKLQREGVYREMKLRRHYEKPSEKRARERAAAVRRARKLERKRMEREGTAR